MLSKELLDKLENKQILTLEEVKYVLDYISEEAKNKAGIFESNQELYFKKKDEIEISNYTLCFECCKEIGKLCHAFNIDYCMIDTQGLQIPDLKHYFGIIKFNTTENLSFIIDLTYIQFLKNKYPIYIDGKRIEVTSPGVFFSTKNKNDLMWDGYITCTERNFKDYVSSFIKANKTARRLDENLILDFAVSQISSFTDINDFELLIQKEQHKNKSNS